MRDASAARGWQLWGPLATIYIVWGSTYPAIRIMVETMPPLLAAGVRFGAAGAIFWIILRLSGDGTRVRATPRQLAGAALIGTLLCFGGNGLVTVAEQDVGAGLAALIIGSMPLWVVLMRTAHGDHPPRATLAGVAVGFAALAVLVLPGDRPGGAPLWGVLVLICAAVLWATGSFYSRRVQLPPDVLGSTAWQMLIGGGTMIVAGMAVGEAGDVHPGALSTRSLLALVYLIAIGSVLGYSAYAWLLKHAPISKVATYAFVNPIVAIFLGWALLDEEVTLTMAIAATAIVLSVATVVRRESAPAARPAEPEARAQDLGEPAAAYPATR